MPYKPPGRTLNFFQRHHRRVSAFRQKHPYWFMFTVGFLVSLPLIAVLGAMIVFPPITPAVLVGVGAFVAHLSLAVSIPAITASVLVSASVIGGLFAAVKRGVNLISRLFGHKPLLVGSTHISGGNSNSVPNKIAQNVEAWNQKYPLHSSSSKSKESLSSSRKSIERASSQPLPEPVLALVRQPKSPRDHYYTDINDKYENARNQIHAHFNKMIAIVGAMNVTGYEANSAKSKTRDSLVKMKREFLQGASVDSLLHINWRAFCGPLDSAQLDLLDKEFNALISIMQSPQYRDFQNAEMQLSSIRDEAQDKRRLANTSYATAGSSLFQNRPALNATLKAVKDKKTEKKNQVYSRFMPN